MIFGEYPQEKNMQISILTGNEKETFEKRIGSLKSLQSTGDFLVVKTHTSSMVRLVAIRTILSILIYEGGKDLRQEMKLNGSVSVEASSK